VRRLLEYQKYKAAGEELGRMDILDREVFCRRARLEQIPLGTARSAWWRSRSSSWSRRWIARSRTPEIVVPHQVIVDRISLGEAIASLVDRLKKEPRTLVPRGARRLPRAPEDRGDLPGAAGDVQAGLIRVWQDESEDILISARDPDNLAPTDIKDDYA